jgi:ribosomal protein S27E
MVRHVRFGAMSNSIGRQMEGSFIDVPCPGCGYVIDVQLVDVRTSAFHSCPCCRAQIHLVDDGSANAGMNRVEEAIDGIGDQLRRMFR